MLSIGKQLMQARLHSGATIEDAAFATRIPHTRLRDMENDDFSNFANLTYAKGFLKLYSRHLGLDLSDYLEQIDTQAVAAVNGHEYARRIYAINTLNSASPLPVVFGSGGFGSFQPDASRPRAGVNAVLAGVSVLVVAILFFKFKGSADADAPPPAAVAQAGASSSFAAQSKPAGVELASVREVRTAARPSGDDEMSLPPQDATISTPVSGSASAAGREAPVPRIISEEADSRETPPAPAAEKGNSSGKVKVEGKEVRRARTI